MRTKSLLLTAVLALAGLSSSMAEVYSINAVGFVNKTMTPGYNLISNPLNATANTLAGVLGTVPAGTSLYKWQKIGTLPGGGDRFGYATFSFEDGAWYDGDGGDASAVSFAPGEGGFIRTSGTFTITFVGDVPTGDLSNALPKGFSMKSSQVPQALPLSDTTPPSLPNPLAHLNFPSAAGDTVYFYRQINATRKGYVTYSYEDGAWYDADGASAFPTPDVGEAFFVRKVAANNWTRTFNVNQ